MRFLAYFFTILVAAFAYLFGIKRYNCIKGDYLWNSQDYFTWKTARIEVPDSIWENYYLYNWSEEKLDEEIDSYHKRIDEKYFRGLYVPFLSNIVK